MHQNIVEAWFQDFVRHAGRDRRRPFRIIQGTFSYLGLTIIQCSHSVSLEKSGWQDLNFLWTPPPHWTA
jgi:hypothetical protein